MRKEKIKLVRKNIKQKRKQEKIVDNAFDYLMAILKGFKPVEIKLLEDVGYLGWNTTPESIEWGTRKSEFVKKLFTDENLDRKFVKILKINNPLSQPEFVVAGNDQFGIISFGFDKKIIVKMAKVCGIKPKNQN